MIEKDPAGSLVVLGGGILNAEGILRVLYLEMMKGRPDETDPTKGDAACS